MKRATYTMFCARFSLLFLLLPAFFGIPVHQAKAEYLSADPQSPEYTPGEVLVRYKPSGHPHGQYAHDYVEASSIDSPDKAFWKVDIGDSLTVPEAVAELQNDPTVESVEPNIVRRATVLPDDPNYDLQWHLHAEAGVDGPAAWDVQTGSSDVVVAVVDTGVDTDHPDLADNIWVNPDEIADNSIDDDNNGYVDDVSGYDFVDDDTDANPSPDGIDNDGYDGADGGVTHGTHVAGIIAAVGDNGVGGSGVSWHTSILPVRVLDDEGSGTDAGIAQGIIYAADLGVDIINMSLGGYGSTTVLEEAVAYAQEKGVLVISAVGNDGINIDDNPFYPACYTDVLGVSATDDTDTPTWFSNFGLGCTDVAAPGDSIYSTLYSGDPTYGFTDDYGYMSGTSMATPVVSGVASLVKASNPSLSAVELKDVIVQNAEDVGLDMNYGYGRVDALLALQGVNVLSRPSTVDGVLAYANSSLNTSYVSGDRHANTQPYFAWTAATDDTLVAGYYVYFGTDASADPSEDGVFQTERDFTPDSITGDAVPYFLRVVAADEFGNLSMDVASFEYVIDTHIDAATGVTLHSSGAGIHVKWSRVTKQHVQKYRVVRRLASSSGAFTSVGSVGSKKTALTDRRVVPGQEYEYAVRAVDDLGNSETSSSVSTTFVPRDRIVVAAGVGGSPLVRIYNPKTQVFEESWFANPETDHNGIDIAVGNVNHNKRDEVIVGLGEGSEPRVKVFTAQGKQLSSFLAYNQSFRGGVRVAVGDVDGDGVDEIITVPGKGMDPIVKIFNRNGDKVGDSFTAFDGNFTGGVFVSVLNWDGIDGDEVAVTPDRSGGPHVQIFNPRNGNILTTFFAYDESFHGGVRTSALHRAGNTADALLTVPLSGAATVKRFERDNQGAAQELGSFPTNFSNGGVISAGRFSSSLTDSIALGNANGSTAVVRLYSATGGTRMYAFNPFGSFIGPIVIATGWVY